MSYVGYYNNGVPATTQVLFEEYTNAAEIGVAPIDGDIQSIHVYMAKGQWMDNAIPLFASIAVYDTALVGGINVPVNLIAESTPVEITRSTATGTIEPKWFDFLLNTPLHLMQGTAYAFALRTFSSIGTGTSYIYRNASTTRNIAWSSGPTGISYGFNNPWVVGYSNLYDFSIYADIGAPTPVDWYLNVSATVGGTTEPVPSIYTYAGNSASATFTATSDAEHQFDGWTLDGAPMGTASITVGPYTDGSTHILVANFSLLPTPPVITNVTQSASEITAGQSVTFTAIVTSDLAYTVYWYDSANNQLAVGGSVPIVFSNAGTYVIHAVAVSGVGSSAPSAGLTVMVNPAPPDKLVVSIIASPTSIIEGTNSTITATVRANNNPVSGATVSLSATNGTLSNYAGLTNTQGIFVTVFTAGIVGTASITGSATHLSYADSDVSSTTINITAQPVPITIAVSGNGTTANPAPGTYPSTYAVGDVVQITAIPIASGATFVKWSMEGIVLPNAGLDNPMMLTITAEMAGKILIAEFQGGETPINLLHYAVIGGAAIVGVILVIKIVK